MVQCCVEEGVVQCCVEGEGGTLLCGGGRYVESGFPVDCACVLEE